ncbi:MAG: hypothetical protein H6Q69_3602 [Firmicutes bacterium]|nr:hypothetical protein [Bacillota bacterium]
MSNQMILWSLIIVPWLTLFFMKKEDIKRFTPVGLFSALTSIIVVEVGQTIGLFTYGETSYPLLSPSYIFGLNPVTTMWLFRFIYGRFWRYLVIDTVLNFGFIYSFHVSFLGSRGIFYEVGITPWQNALIATIHGIFVYVYHAWQEGAFVRSEQTNSNTNIQPVLAKPITQDEAKDSSRKK